MIWSWTITELQLRCQRVEETDCPSVRCVARLRARLQHADVVELAPASSVRDNLHVRSKIISLPRLKNKHHGELFRTYV